MTPAQIIAQLRAATEDDVALALDRAFISLPLSDPAELLELFNRLLDVLTGEDDAAEMQDEASVEAVRRTPCNDE